MAQFRSLTASVPSEHESVDLLNDLDEVWSALDSLQESRDPRDRLEPLHGALSRLEQSILRSRSGSLASLAEQARSMVSELSASFSVPCAFLVESELGDPAEFFIPRGDIHLLGQVLIHALRNSFAHGFGASPPRERSPVITLRFGFDIRGLCVTLTDNGRGVQSVMKGQDSEESSSATLGLMSGRGLGFSTIEGVATRLGGFVRVSHPEGAGYSVQIVFLPQGVGLRALHVSPEFPEEQGLPSGLGLPENWVNWRSWSEGKDSGAAHGTLVRDLILEGTSGVSLPSLRIQGLQPPVFCFFRRVAPNLALRSKLLESSQGSRGRWIGRYAAFRRFGDGALSRPLYLISWDPATGSDADPL